MSSLIHHPSAFICCAVGLWLATSAAAAPVELVTETEAEASRTAPPRLEFKSVSTPGRPTIELRAPTLGGPLTPPVRIDLRFNALNPARINPDSFRVRYGSFRLDITHRIRGNAQVLAEGVEVAQAMLPKGSHRLFIEVADTTGRVGELSVEFEVR